MKIPILKDCSDVNPFWPCGVAAKKFADQDREGMDVFTWRT